MAPSLEKSIKAAYVRSWRMLRKAANRTGVISFLDRYSRFRSVHWLRSLFEIHDLSGLIALDVPWWTYAAIHEVDLHLRKLPSARALEFGSGSSTVWLSKRCASVVSIEHSEYWFNKLSSVASDLPNVEIILAIPTWETQEPEHQSSKDGYRGADFHKYVSAVDRHAGLFDLIIVDGRARLDCLIVAEKLIAPGGLVVFDDSNRKRYRKLLRALRADVRHCRGFAPTLPYRSQTSLIHFD